MNTNFTIANSIWQSAEQVTNIQMQAGFTKPNDPASMRTWQDYLDVEEANLTAMHTPFENLRAAGRNSASCVRPHPGEELQEMGWTVRRSPNVKVIREGAHLPWTMACRLLLHTSCTTGFEAHVAGKIALSLVPRSSWITSSLISNRVNPTFSDPLAIVSAAETILDGKPAPSPQPHATPPEQYVRNYCPQSRDSADCRSPAGGSAPPRAADVAKPARCTAGSEAEIEIRRVA